MKKIQDYLRIRSVRGKFFLVMALCIMIPLIIIGAITSSLSSSTLNRNAIVNNQNYLKNLISVVDTNLSDMDRLSKVAFSDAGIQRILSDQSSRSAEEQIADTAQMDQLFRNLITIRDNISGIYIFNLDGLLYEHSVNRNTFDRDYDYKKKDWFQDGVKSNGVMVVVGSHLQEYLNFSTRSADVWQDRYVFSVFRQINSFSPYKAIGYILIDQPVRMIDNIIKQMNLNHSETVIIDDKANIVYEPSGKYISKPLLTYNQSLQPILDSDNGYFYVKFGAENYLATYQKSSYSNWKFISLVPYSVITQDSGFITRATVFISLLCFLLSLVIASKAGELLTKPIKDMLVGMKRVGKGDFDVLLDTKSGDEMEELTDGFNKMTGKIKTLIQSEYEAQIKQKESEVQQREAELRALHSQINPHFLYNTLESIRTLAALNGDKHVAEMVYSLSNLFRMSMSRGKKYVTLGSEIELVKHYLFIQQIRYDNKFSASFLIFEELSGARIPSFILQPIVENAVLHGMDPKDGPGVIEIRARSIQGNTLVIEISDDGVGMSEDEIRTLNAYISRILEAENMKGLEEEEEHIGIANVCKRIKISAGEGYGMEIIANEKGGITTKLIFPLIFSDEKTSNN